MTPPNLVPILAKEASKLPPLVKLPTLTIINTSPPQSCRIFTTNSHSIPYLNLNPKQQSPTHMSSSPQSAAEGGGFLLSPPASSILSTSTSSHTPTLPVPRHTPLRAGGSKESIFIRHVDQQLLHLRRRFAKRTTPSSSLLSAVDREKADAWGDVRGYASMREACRDIETLVALIWVSGTPSLQVPYLITVGLLVGDVIEGMPPSSRSLFRLLGKLDYAFASLLQGRDVESGERLPGVFGGRKGMSGTEKVRVRSLVERTRVAVVEAFKKGEFEFGGDEEEEEEEGEGDEDGLVIERDGMEMEEEDEEEDSWDMQIARVYDRTIVELGDTLEEPNIGIITEGRA